MIVGLALDARYAEAAPVYLRVSLEDLELMADFLAVVLRMLIMLRPFALPAATFAKLCAADGHFLEFGDLLLTHEELLDVSDLVRVLYTDVQFRQETLDRLVKLQNRMLEVH